jgi:hypothetical protein
MPVTPASCANHSDRRITAVSVAQKKGPFMMKGLGGKKEA